VRAHMGVLGSRGWVQGFTVGFLEGLRDPWV
jgi:hypothetical protein